jgi:Phage integrase family
LRYSEIASIKPESFDWQAPSVTVAAAYTKNGRNAVMPLPDDLTNDLRLYVKSLTIGSPVFPLPKDKGAELLQADLAVAGIVYQDASGLYFDFHSLRCQTATLADAAGVSLRVVQRLMRHSTLELTGRYTRPRAVDIEAVASMLPSLKPEGSQPESAAATGTDRRFPPTFVRRKTTSLAEPVRQRGGRPTHKRCLFPPFSHRTGRRRAGTAGNWRDEGFGPASFDGAQRSGK